MSKDAMTQSLAIRQESVAVNGMNELAWFGKQCALSGIIGCESEAQGVMVAHHLHTTGQSLFELEATHHLFEGRLTKKAESMLADLRRLGGSYKILARTSEEAAIYIEYKGAELEFRFTWAEAQGESYPYGKDGKSLKYNWSTPRKRTQMLWARVVSDGVRTCCPEASNGQYPIEIVQDFDTDTQRAERTVADVEVEVLPPEHKRPAAKDPAPAPATAEPKAPLGDSEKQAKAGKGTKAGKAKAKAEPKADAKPEAANGPELEEFSRMPIGRMKGKLFSELTISQLEQIGKLDPVAYPAITDAHRLNAAHILAAMQDDEAAKKGGQS